MRTGLTCRPGPLRVVALGSFAAFERPAFAMERIHSLPTEVSARIREQFYPAGALAKGPALLRLFFGSDFANSNVTGTFFDVTRYRRLASSEEGIADGLPGAEIVAEAMGHILGRIQVLGGYDGRGIKFVLGENGYSGFEFYVIDFHQVRGSIFALQTLVHFRRRSVGGTALLKLLASSSMHTGQLKCTSHFHAEATEYTRHSDVVTTQPTVTILALLTNFSMESRPYSRYPVQTNTKQRTATCSWVRTMA